MSIARAAVIILSPATDGRHRTPGLLAWAALAMCITAGGCLRPPGAGTFEGAGTLSERGAVIGRHVELRPVSLMLDQGCTHEAHGGVRVAMLLSERHDRQVLSLSGTIRRMVDQNGADLLKDPGTGGTEESREGVCRGYSSSAKYESGEQDLVCLGGARGPGAGARWVDVEADLRVVTGGRLATAAPVDVPLCDGEQFQIGPVRMELRRGEAAEKALGWSKDDSSGWGGSSPGFFLVARKADWERLGHLGMKSGQTFCDSCSPLDTGRSAGGALWAVRVTAQGPMGDRLRVEGSYWEGVEEEIVPVRLRVGVPPRDVAPGGGTLDPADLVPWAWKMPDNTPRLNGVGTDVMVEAADVEKPWEECIEGEAFPPTGFWVGAEVRSRSGRAIIGLDARVDRLCDDTGMNLLHLSPHARGGRLPQKGVRAKARWPDDGLLHPAGPGHVGPLMLKVCGSQWPADDARRIRLEGELTMVTALRTTPVEAKIRLDARTREVQLGDRTCCVRWDSRDDRNAFYFTPPSGPRYVEELRILDAGRQPLPVRELMTLSMGAPGFVLETGPLPQEVILAARVWTDIEQVRVPLRLEWANRWTPSSNLESETASPEAGSDLRVDVHGWTLRPHMWDEPRLQIELGVRSTRQGPVSVQNVWWWRAADDTGADLLAGPIEYDRCPAGAYVEMHSYPPERPLAITLTAAQVPSAKARQIHLEVWLDVGSEDAPRWVPFRIHLPVGADRP